MKVFELLNEVGTGITIEMVRDMLKEAKGEAVTFRIATLGGAVDTGLAIHDLIKMYEGETTAEIIGMTASAGTIIALGCDNIKMSENALFLIHNSWTQAVGNSMDLKKIADSLDKNDNIMLSIYKQKTNLEPDKIKELMLQEDWLTAGEAKELGFVNEIIQTSMKVAASVSDSGLSDILLKKLENKMKFFANKNEEVPQAALVIENGEYQLSDGRILVMVDGLVTEIKEAVPEMEDKADAVVENDTQAVVEAVATMLADFETKIEAQVLAFKASATSVHKPVKSSSIDIQTEVKFDVHERLQAKVKEIKSKFNKEKTI